MLRYIVMEYVPGQTLEDLVSEHGGLDPVKACDVVHQIASALAEAHKHDLVHRDIKPSNIMVTPEGQAKLLDFGLVHQIGNNLTEAGTVLATMDFMSPEQCQDASSVDIRRRALLAADLLGLMIAFVIAELALPGDAHDRLEPAVEIGLFVLTLPFFVVTAKLQGLYDHDEERTDHTTADDLVGVFYLVTTGTWLFFATMYLSEPRVAERRAAVVLLGALDRPGRAVSSGGPRTVPPERQLPPEHDHRRRRRGRVAARAQDPSAPGVWPECRRLRRLRGRESTARSCSAASKTSSRSSSCSTSSA